MVRLLTLLTFYHLGKIQTPLRYFNLAEYVDHSSVTHTDSHQAA